jgi:hypothetical protein
VFHHAIDYFSAGSSAPIQGKRIKFDGLDNVILNNSSMLYKKGKGIIGPRFDPRNTNRSKSCYADFVGMT